MTDPSKQIDLTNQSGGSVKVLLPTTAVPTDSTGPPHVYEQALEILSTVDSKATLADGAKGTYLLDQTYIDPKTNKPTYSLVYELLVSKTDWLTPVANIGVFQDIFHGPAHFEPVTATADEATALANAATFIQTIDAYPTAPLTKAYQQAMDGSVTAGTSAADGGDGSADRAAAAMAKTVDDFFKGTKSFQNVTLSGVVAMNSYYRAFPFVWAQYGDATYYLYSSDGKATSFVGTISLKKPSNVDITQPNSGYIITFIPAKSPADTSTVDTDATRANPLTYSGGLFLDDAQSDIPRIAVRGTFQLKRTFTQTPTDTQVLTVLSGTIDGQVCVGFDRQQLSTSKDSEFWNTLFHPKGAQQIFNTIMQLGGALMTLHFLGSLAWGAIKWLRNRGKANEPVSDAEAKSFTDDMRAAVREEVETALKKQSDGKVEAPKDGEAAVEQAASDAEAIQDNLKAASLEEGLVAQAASLEEMAKYESDMSSADLVQLEKVGTDIENAQAKLDAAAPEDLGDVVPDVSKAMDGISGDVGTLSDSLAETLSADSAKSIEANKTATEDAAKSVEDSDTNAEEAAEGEGPEIEPVLDA